MMRPLSLAAILVAGTCRVVHAQGSIGTLKTEGAEISGLVTVSGGRATVGSNGTIATSSQVTEVSLTRGGGVKVCAGSSVRLSQPTLGVAHPPLLTALNRGAMEVKTSAAKNDVILPPDMRLEVSDAAPLDLRIRLVANGDTCVDNAGKDAPMLHVTEAFGTGAYFIRPGQRVLFEHGSLSEVVDHETSNCGCPGSSEAVVLAGKGKRGDGTVTPQTPAAQANPFPEAVSQGLQQPTIPQAESDQTHVQVSSTLKYSGTNNAVTGPPGEATPATSVSGGSGSGSGTGASGTPAGNTGATIVQPEANIQPVSAGVQTPTQARIVEAAPPPAGPNLFRALGHFFKRLFGGS